MTFPNYITLSRIILTPFFFTVLIYYEAGKEYYRWIALGLLLTAMVTDALDGFLARIARSRSKLGRFLDPLADKLVLLSGFLALLFVEALKYRPPLWITVTIVFRDMVIVIGLILIFVLSGRIRVKTNFLGKVTTACQMVTLFVILLQWKISIPLCYVTAGLSILSGLVYIFRDFKWLGVTK